MNEYEKDNPLQKMWETTSGGGCLCTMRESCSVCSNYEQRRKQKKLIMEIANSQGYQLYNVGWPTYEPRKLDMEIKL